MCVCRCFILHCYAINIHYYAIQVHTNTLNTSSLPQKPKHVHIYAFNICKHGSLRIWVCVYVCVCVFAFSHKYKFLNFWWCCKGVVNFYCWAYTFGGLLCCWCCYCCCCYCFLFLLLSVFSCVYLNKYTYYCFLSYTATIKFYRRY